MARLQSLELDKKIGLENVTQARAEEALELTDFVLVNIVFLHVILNDPTFLELDSLRVPAYFTLST